MERKPTVVWRGGARVGWLTATWPFASLRASPTELVLSGPLGVCNFSPSEVSALEPYRGLVPFLSRGIRIVHVRDDVPESVVFFCFGDPRAKIQAILDTGFLPTRHLAV